MILLSHPTGNTFVRALLVALEQADILDSFHTSIAVEKSDWYIDILPQPFQKELLRRTYSIPISKVSTYPLRELVRLAASKLHIQLLTTHETGWASVDAVYRNLDRQVAQDLAQRKDFSTGVYCYEDAAFQTFQAARHLGLKCFYDLPIAYWQTSRQLLEAEAQRLPEWEPTLVGTQDSSAKLERKTQELELADVVICPSKFVYTSLPEIVRQARKCVIAEFGSPEISAVKQHPRSPRSPLRVLFAGSMSQRKGLADLFAAMKLLKRSDVELVVMGTPLMPLEFYRSHFPDFIYQPTRPHQAVLELMQSCDVLVLPSIVEGRALVQQEAMSSGLPLIVTANAGGEDLIEEGKTGFLVPIRDPEAIAENLSWMADHRDEVDQMGKLAQQKAQEKTWQRYGQVILEAIQSEEGADSTNAIEGT